MTRLIEVNLVQEGDIYTIHTGSPVLGDIVMDYTGYAETARGGNSAVLLISSAISCFAGSLRAALIARNIPFRRIHARGTGEKELNEAGAARLKRISIEITVDADECHAARIEHCARIVRSCTITASLLEGIQVTHSICRA